MTKIILWRNCGERFCQTPISSLRYWVITWNRSCLLSAFSSTVFLFFYCLFLSFTFFFGENIALQSTVIFFSLFWLLLFFSYSFLPPLSLRCLIYLCLRLYMCLLFCSYNVLCFYALIFPGDYFCHSFSPCCMYLPTFAPPPPGQIRIKMPLTTGGLSAATKPWNPAVREFFDQQNRISSLRTLPPSTQTSSAVTTDCWMFILLGGLEELLSRSVSFLESVGPLFVLLAGLA